MILVPIVEKYSTFTDTEKKIADFILNDPEQALNKNVNQMAQLSDTSPSAISRFSQKIGFESFADMKVGLAKYFRSNQYFEKDMIITASDTHANCVNKLLAQINDVCTSTADQIDYGVLSQVIHMIDHAECVYLMGIGSSAIAATDLQMKLLRINKRAFFLQDSEVNLLSTITITNRDVVLAFSFTGNTDIVLASVKAAKRQGAYVIAVTGSPDSPIGKCANACLRTPAIERKVRIGAVSSRYSQQYICDLIFLCLISEHYADAEKLTLSAANLLTSIR